MNFRATFLLSFALIACLLLGANAGHKLERLKGAPDGLSDQIAGFLDPQGYRVTGPDGPVCDIWLGKNLGVTPSFKPTLSVKYPFGQGEFIGVLRVPEDAEFSDFRGQVIESGVYTLRYGQQPMDGNHIGTSELADFLLALPAENDKEPLPINFVEQLHTKSAETAGSTHPAIFSLLPPAEDAKGATLEHEEDDDFLILNLIGTSQTGDEKKAIPIRVVVIGETDI